MICLGIESTAHTFGIGIIDEDGEVLANQKSLFTTKKGGLIPNEVAEHHKKIWKEMLEKALHQAKITMNDVDLIAYSASPGLPTSLKVGLEVARQLASENKKPLIGINHCVAHLTIGELKTGAKNPVYLYISGVNTQVIALAGKRFRIFGETLDIGLGNALDKFGREAGLGFPAGPKIEELALKGKYVELPYSVKGMDVSFAGIVTKCSRLLKKGFPIGDICYSFQETAFAMVTEVAERALAHCEKKELLVIGGVAANKRLAEMLSKMCAERGAKLFVVPFEYAGDQGVMIAWQGLLEYKAGKQETIEKADIYPYLRTDEVNVSWE